MIKRVKLDSDRSMTEIDWKSTHRTARDLKEYIASAPVDEAAKYRYKSKLNCWLRSILKKSIKIPFPYANAPYDIGAIMEGTEPEFVPEFSKIYASLLNKISADINSFSLSTYESGEFIPGKYKEVDEDGTVYELCWFED